MERTMALPIARAVRHRADVLGGSRTDREAIASDTPAGRLAVKRARGVRGVALMLVLWLIVVLGAIAVGVAALSRGAAGIVDNVRTRAAARYAAESGIVAATWRLEQLLRAAETPRDQALLVRRRGRVVAG